MAQAIAATDRATAFRLLDEAFIELERLAAQNLETGQPSPLTVATGLLPIVEQVAPDRLPDVIGRAVLLRTVPGAIRPLPMSPNWPGRPPCWR